MADCLYDKRSILEEKIVQLLVGHLSKLQQYLLFKQGSSRHQE